MKRVGETETIELAALALLEFGKSEKALQAVEEMDDSRDKAWTLNNIVSTAESIADEAKDPVLLEQAHQVAKKIEDPQEKARVLSDIADTAVRMADETKDPGLLEHAHQVAKEIDDPQEKARTLSDIADTAVRMADETKDLHRREHGRGEEGPCAFGTGPPGGQRDRRPAGKGQDLERNRQGRHKEACQDGGTCASEEANLAEPRVGQGGSAVHCTDAARIHGDCIRNYCKDGGSEGAGGRAPVSQGAARRPSERDFFIESRRRGCDEDA